MPAAFWRASCTCANDGAASVPVAVSRPHLSFDATSSDDAATSASLRSNPSLRTLPSISSLQSFVPPSAGSDDSSLSHLLISSLRPHRSHVASLAFSPSFLYSASGNQIRAWDVATFSQLDAFNFSGDGAVKALVFSSGRVFTAHQDCRIRVWEVADARQGDGRLCHRLSAALPTFNDRILRSLFPSNYVQVRRHRKRLWLEHADAVSGLAVSASGGLLYSVSWDKTLKVWRTSDFRCVQSVTAHEDAVNAVAVAADGTVYTGSADRSIRVWAREEGEKRLSLKATLEKHKSAVNSLALAGDGAVLYSGACDRSILVWERERNARHMAVVGALRGHGGAILCLINVEDLLFSGSTDRTVRIWHRGGDGKYACLGKLEGHVRAVKSLGAVWDGSAGGYTVCSGTLDGEIRVWHVRVPSRPDPRSGSYPDLLDWKVRLRP